MEVIEISRKIMEYMDAFQGSKPVVHNPDAMVIRNKSASKLKKEDMQPKLKELFEYLGIQKVEVGSEKSRKLTEKVDSTFRRTEEVYDESNGIDGIEKLKHTFEITGFDAEYIMGQIGNIAVYVVVWMDRSGFGPMFVEAMVVNIIDEE
ncbi:MAG: DUF2120 family protein [Methanosphaera sp.]|nr:DUF2120 family protein [Methanosphaera sp.]